MKAMFGAYPAALRAYPAEALVALCESVQTDEKDARCRTRGAGHALRSSRKHRVVVCQLQLQVDVALVSQTCGT